MKKALKRNPKSYWYWKDGKQIFDKPNSIVGEIPEGVSGNLSDVSGEIPAGVSGNLSGVSGNLSGVSGNLDDCGLTDEEREAGVKIEDLIGE